MSERAIIESRLLKKQTEVQQLEEKLRTARIYLQALNDILRMLGGSQASEAEPKAGSMIAQAKEAIQRAACPLHVNELLKSMGKSEDSKSSLTGSLAAYVRRGELFTRPAPNTYGLVELGHGVRDNKDASQPPSGFGGGRPPRPNFNDVDDDVSF